MPQAYVPVLNTVLVEMRMGLMGESIENTLYFNQATAWDVPGMEALALAMRNWWDQSYSQHLSNVLSLNEIYVTDLTTQTSPAVSFVTGMPIPAGGTEEPMPNSVCCCVSFKTAARGRSFRGRNYVSALQAQEVLVNSIQPTTLAGIVQAYQTLFTVAGALDVTWVVVSRYQGYTIVNNKKIPTPRAAGLFTPIISATVADNVVDNMRTRLPRH